MALRQKTKHKGIYKVGDTYYITYYVGPKKYEKAIEKFNQGLEIARELGSVLKLTPAIRPVDSESQYMPGLGIPLRG